jgi:SPW repeat
MQKQLSSESWIDGTNLCLGVILFGIPWVVASATQAVDWNAWIVGGLIAFNACCALVGFAAWEEWTNLVLGLWAAISPWLFGFQGNVGATWTYVILGCAVGTLAAVQLWLINRQLPGVKA